MRNLRQLLKLYNQKQAQQICRRQDFPRNTVLVDFPSQELPQQQKTFKKGDKAPYAYNDVFIYPKDYQPWNFNYKGDGLFYGCLFAMFFAYFQYEVSYLKRTGRDVRPVKEQYYQP